MTKRIDELISFIHFSLTDQLMIIIRFKPSLVNKKLMSGSTYYAVVTEN